MAVAPRDGAGVCVCVQRWREQLAAAVLLLGLAVSPEVTFPACSESQLPAGLQEVLACRHLALPGSLRCLCLSGLSAVTPAGPIGVAEVADLLAVAWGLLVAS